MSVEKYIKKLNDLLLLQLMLQWSTMVKHVCEVLGCNTVFSDISKITGFYFCTILEMGKNKTGEIYRALQKSQKQPIALYCKSLHFE